MREVVRIVGECRELGADPGAWHAHATRRLCDLTGSQVGIAANLRDFEPGADPKGLSLFRFGWHDTAAEQAWNEYASTVPARRTPEYARLVGFEGPLVTRTRRQLWDDLTWYRSQTFNDHHRVSGIDHYIFSIARVGHRSAPALPARNGASSAASDKRPRPLYNTIWLHRPVGEAAYTRREWWLVHSVHAELSTLVGTALAAADAPTISGLTRRQRQTLDALLDGDSEKQIAARLGLSRATVHEYVTAIYRHFGAASRGELLARFVGVSRPPREPN